MPLFGSIQRRLSALRQEFRRVFAREPTAPPPRELDLRFLEDRILYSASPLAAELLAAQSSGLEGQDVFVESTVVAADPNSGSSTSPNDPNGAQLSSIEQIEMDLRDLDTLLAQLHALDEQPSSESNAISSEDLPPADLTPASRSLDIVLVDDQLKDLEQLTSAIAWDVRYILYDASQTSAIVLLDQVRELAMTSGQEIGSLSFIAHGGPGWFGLGTDRLGTQDLLNGSEVAAAWQSLESVLVEDATIALYACSLDSSGQGQALLDRLAELTGADVYASDDTTGISGDWDLEAASFGASAYVSGVLDPLALAAWHHDLNTLVRTDSVFDGFIIHTFTTDSNLHTAAGTWTVPTGVTSVEVLVVAGGGAGGGYADINGQNGGAGGGAGGLLYDAAYSVTPGATFTVQVGGGGIAFLDAVGGNGGNSIFANKTAIGGGGGAAFNSGPGQTGGSGGGGTPSGPAYGPGSGTHGQGNDGSVTSNANVSGGGGGAGASAGGSWSSLGGEGREFSQFAMLGLGDPAYPGWFAGGGAGFSASPNYGDSYGGKGGGGNSAYYYTTPRLAASGAPGTGGGGGGGRTSDPAALSGSGGSGIVIVRYSPVSITDAEDEIFFAGESAITISGNNFGLAQGGGKVELASSGDYASATKVQQTISNWETSSIDFTASLGSLSAGSLFLFVTDANGYRSAGYAVTLQQQFADVTTAAGVDAGSSMHKNAAWGDYDNDGDLDLVVGNDGQANILYRNNGNGSFTDVTATAGVGDTGNVRGLAWADYNRDGNLDLFVANYNGGANALYRNNGNGTFTNVAATAGVNDTGASHRAIWGDYDRDGLLDLYVAGISKLYRNMGNGTFSDVSNIAGVSGISGNDARWGDLDNDGDLDLMVVGWNSGSVYRNNSDGTFTDISVAAGVINPSQALGMDLGDYDNDGDLDVYVAVHGQPNVLYRNNWVGTGTLTFTDVAATAGVNDSGNGYEGHWGDYDRDGDQDLYVSNWGTNLLYRNNGNGTFTDIAATAGVNRNNGNVASVWGDYDSDGDLDLYVLSRGVPNVLYRNDANAPSLNSAPVLNGPNSTGLVAFWALNESSGTNASDSSGNNRHGTLNNMEENDWISGNFGNALSFDGVNDHVTFSDAGLPSGNASRTMSGWIKTTMAEEGYLVQYGTISGTQGFGLGVYYSKAVFTQIGSNIQSTTTITDGKWHHLAVTYDGTWTRLYVDGVLEASSNSMTINTQLSTGRLGGGLDGTRSLNGMGDDIRIYGRALSAEEIAAQAARIMPLSSITEDNTTSAGNTVAEIIDAGMITDADLNPSTGAPEALAITTIDNRNGKWQYRIGTSSWIDINAAQLTTKSLLLDSANSLRFVPNAEWSGTASFTFRAWDKTLGLAGDYITMGATGGSTPFSTGTATATITVSPVNDAPTFSDTLGGTVSFTEGGSAVVLDSNVQVFDAENSISNFSGSTLTLVRSGGASAEDLFSATGTLGVLTQGSSLTVDGITIGTVTTNSAGTLVLTFNNSATNALVNSAMQQIAYSNSSDGAPANIQIEWTITTAPPNLFTYIGGAAGIGNIGGEGWAGQWGDYDRDGDLDLYVTNGPSGQSNVLYRNNGNGTVTDVTVAAGVGHTGNGYDGEWGDYDGDGYLDIYITNWGTANVLYRNNGNGTFTDVTATAGVGHGGNGRDGSWGDYDNDGDLDLYVTNWSGQANVLYRNNGDGTFTDVASAAGVSASGVSSYVGAWGDFDSDGDLDLYVTNFGSQSNILYRNNGNGTFTDITSTAGVSDTANDGWGVVWGDYDNDSDLDLYIINRNQPNVLYRNNGNGTFTDVAVAAGVADAGDGRDGAWGDFDGDGDLDLYVANGGADVLYRNNGNGTFTNITALAGVGNVETARDIEWGDFDGDGDLDLYIATAPSSNALYRNDANIAAGAQGVGDGVTVTGQVTVNITGANDAPVLNTTFSPTLGTVLEGATDPSGVTVADLVFDGSITDPDGSAVEAIAITALNTSLGTWQYSLNGGGSWLDVDTTSINSTANELALLLGPTAQLRLVPTGDLNGSLNNAITFRAWDMSTGSEGQYVIITSTGGGTAFSIASGTVTITVTPVNDAPTFTDTLGGTVTFTEGGTPVVLDSNVQVFDAENSISNFSGSTLTLSRSGGASAEDLFSATGTLGALTQGSSLTVGGITIGTVTTNSAGTLVLTFNSSATNALVNSAMQQIAYSNSSDGAPANVQIEWTITTAPPKLFTEIAGAAGVADPGNGYLATWADYDKDGDLDLYITNNGPNVLYRNNGNGTFTDVTTVAGVGQADNGYDGIWGDYDNDGDPDLYVSNWWGQPNVLYRNNGNGTFTDVTALAGLVPFGGATHDSDWVDYDGDGYLDIYITEHYHANILYRNNGDGTFTNTTTASGLGDAGNGTASSWADFDNDGDLDVYVMNQGANALYRNNGNGTFTNITVSAGVNYVDTGGLTTRNGAWGDFDNDGHLDLYLGNQGADVLYRNNGNGTFTDISGTAGIGIGDVGTARSAVWGDYDGDGFLDMYVTNDGQANVLYRNNGNGTFTNITSIAGVGDSGWGRDGVWSDFDGDGDPDIYVTNGGANLLYRNDTNLVAGSQGAGSLTVTGQVTVNITNVNDAPVLNTTFNPTLGTVLEGATNPSGVTVAALVVDGSITDPDGSAVETVAITALNTSLGTWQYSLNGGGSWLDVDTTFINSTANELALLLGPTAQLRLVPTGDLNGSLSNAITFRAWDQSTGSEGQYVVITSTGGGTAFSSVSDTATISVTPVNDAPTFSDTLGGTVSFTEGGSPVVLDSNVQVFDAENSISNFSGSTLTLVRSGGANSQDLFSATGTLGVLTQGSSLTVDGITIGTVTTNSAGTLVLTFDSSATNALVNSAMQQIAYSNSSDGVSANVQIEWTITTAPPSHFTNLTAGSGITLTGLNRASVWGDYDNDGDLDLYIISNGGNTNALYRNDGNGTFTNVTAIAGVGASVGAPEWGDCDAAWADYDGDGYLDLYLAHWGPANILYRNNGDGTFTNVTATAGVGTTRNSRDVAWADYDNDGDLDIYVSNWSQQGNLLYRNNGDGTFADVTASAGVSAWPWSSFAGRWGDYNNDGLLDLYVTTYASHPNLLYRNNGDGTFTDVTATAGVSDTANHGYDAAWGDFNNDGFLDLYVSNGLGNILYRNNGNETFTDVTASVGVSQANGGSDASWIDYDADGDMDLYLTNWGGSSNVMYRNNGNGTFTDITTTAGLSSVVASSHADWGDFDGDGDIDLMVSNFTPSTNFLYRNDANIAAGAQGVGDGVTATGQVTVNITGVNDAPVLNTTFNPTLGTVLEGATNPSGVTVASLVVDGSITDPDGSAVEAIAITGLNTSLGTWQYSLNEGASWLAINAEIINNQTNELALLLGPTAQLRLIPFGDLTGSMSDAITFRAWDQSSGLEGEYAVIISNGGSTAFSTASDTASIAVTAVNDAPTFFRGDGITTSGLWSPTWSSNDFGRTMVLQHDGKIIEAGISYVGSWNFSMVRWNADGSRDATFGVGGRVSTPIGGLASGYSLVIQPDGKLILAGLGRPVSGDDFALIRYNTDGTLDSSFGTNGIVTTAIGTGTDQGRSVALQLDGKIVVGGVASIGSTDDFALVRYNADGSRDNSFGNAGIVTTAIGTGSDYGNSLTIQPDGKILVAGTASISGTNDFALVRYNADGSLDTSFGTSGRVTTGIGTSHDSGNSVIVQADGKILVAGTASISGTDDFALVRYNANGSLDTSFGTSGRVTTAIGTASDSGSAVTLQTDGKILVAGTASISGVNRFAVVRYNSNGSLDGSFGSGGIVTTAGTISAAVGGSVLVQPDGKIVVSGYDGDSGIPGRQEDFCVVRYNADGSLDTTFDLASTLGGSVSYTENGSPVVLDSDVRIFDVELSAANTFNGATLTLVRNGGANSQDVFSASGTLGALTQGGNLTVGGTTIGTVTTNSGGSLVLTFNGSATNALVNSAMQQIAYANSSDAPPSNVQIDWTFSDGNGGAQGSGGALTDTGSVTVNITGVNDAPVAANDTFTTSEDTAVTFDVRTNDSDIDSPTLSVTQINGSPIAIGGSVAVTGGSVRLNVGGTLTFTPTANYNGSPSFNYTLSDGSLTATASVNGTVIAVDDAPTFTDTLGGSVSFTEGGSPVVLDSNVQIFDAENSVSNFSRATLTLSRSGGANSQDQFSATGTLGALMQGSSLTVGGITIGTVTTNSNGTLILTFNSNATNALVNSAMQQIAYANSSDAAPANVQIAWTMTTLSPLTFTDVTAIAGVGDTGNAFDGTWGDYDGDGDADLYITNVGSPNILYRNDGNGTFTNVTAAAGVGISGFGRDASWGDYDSDGDLDLYVSNTGANILYRNNGNGTFTDVTVTAGVGDTSDSRDGVWGDYDGDGDLDLYITNHATANLLYRNNGNGTFTDVTATAGVGDTRDGRDGSWGDYDGDGDLDLYVTNDNGHANVLYRNEGNGTFTNVTASAGVGDTGNGNGNGAWGDYDGDGDMDLYIVNSGANVLYRNNGNGTFTNVTASAGVGDIGSGGAGDWGDVDGDGDLDLYITNGHTQLDVLYRNNGDGTFTNVTVSAGIWDARNGTASEWADYDGDGDLDLYISNYGTANILYRNDTNVGVFSLTTTGQVTVNITGVNDAPVAANDTFTTSEDTAVTFDVRTNDSDIDSPTLSVTQINGSPIAIGGSVAVTSGSVRLNAGGTLTFTPTANYNGSPSFTYTLSDGSLTATASVNGTVIAVDDAPTFTNTLGGAVAYTEGGTPVVLDSNVQVFDAENSISNFSGSTLTLSRSGGANSQDLFSATGTLGTLTQGSSLTVGGITIGTVTTNSNGTLTLTFNSNATNTLVNSAMQQIAYANSSDSAPANVQIAWTMTTLPPLTFTDVTAIAGVGDTGNGIGTAWGDYDCDGDLDLYVVNYGQANILYRNNGDGTFTDVTALAGVGHSAATYGGALWGDYDGDGHLDLYLTNHGQANVLYRNNGDGTFTDNTATAGVGHTGIGFGTASSDYDGDGDLDLYITNIWSANVLYRNNGNGTFTDVAAAAGVSAAGVGSRGASWGDYDGDGRLDLYVTNSGGANTLFRNNGDGTFTNVTAAAGVAHGGNSQGAVWGDYDGDGYLDLYVANWGGHANGLYRNNGDGTFTNVATAAGVDYNGWTPRVAWADVDNDGRLDLYLNNGSNLVYRNNGDGSFTNVTTTAGVGDVTDGYSAVWGDVDVDGDLDLYVANFGANVLYLNNTNPAVGTYLQVAVRRDGVLASGLTVELMDGDTRVATRTIDGGSGRGAQNATPVHFAGLNPATSYSIRYRSADGTLHTTLVGTPSASVVTVDMMLPPPAPNVSVASPAAHGLTTTGQVTVNITGVNDAPIAMGESYQTNFLTPFSMRWSDLLANDTDVEGDALSIQILAVPSRGAVVMDGNGGMTYRPETNFVGSVTIVYAVSDGSLVSDPQTVQIAIGMPPTTVVSLSENRGGAAFTRIDAINVSSAVASTNLSESTTIAMAGISSVSGDANSASSQSLSGNQSAAGSANIVGSANAVGGGSLGGQIVPANAAEPGGGAMDWGVRNRLETIVEDTDLAFDLARFHLNWITDSKISELAVIQRLQLDPWGRVGLDPDELAFLDSVQSKKDVLLEVRNREYFVKTAAPIVVGTAIGAGISLHVLMTAHFGSSLLSQSGVFMPLDPLTILEGSAKVKKSKAREDLLFEAASLHRRAST